MKLKPTNHMRPSGGAAFPLPSVDWVPLRHAHDTLLYDTARWRTTDTSGGHGRPFKSEIRANSPSGSGACPIGCGAMPVADWRCGGSLDDG